MIGTGPGLAAAREFFVHLAVTLVPLFVAGALLAGLLREYLPPRRVERALGRYDGGSGNVAAAVVGALTPFCSCSTVPVLAGLLGAGAPLGLSFSFLLASPLVNELAVVLLLGAFGVEAAALYVGVTLAAAVAGGVIVGRLGLEHRIADARLLAADGGGSATGCGACGAASEAVGSDACRDASTRSGDACGASTGSDPHHVRARRAAAGAAGFLVDLLPYLLLGMTVGAAVHGFVPAALLRRVLGPENPLAVPLAAVAGAPLYVSLSAMLPLAASFAENGVPVGTVLAFVVGGAGVSLPNLVLLSDLFDRVLLAAYALAVVVTGVAVGLLFNALPL